jgi:hypothetical protein
MGPANKDDCMAIVRAAPKSVHRDFAVLHFMVRMWGLRQMPPELVSQFIATGHWKHPLTPVQQQQRLFT